MTVTLRNAFARRGLRVRFPSSPQTEGPEFPGLTGTCDDLAGKRDTGAVHRKSARRRTMWISAPDDHCLGSSNGHFTADAHVAAAVIQAYRTGTWASPASNSSNECLSATGRLGQQSALVSVTPVTLVVCRNSDARPGATATDTELTAIVAALNRLPSARNSFAFKCTGQGYPAAGYSLIFKYSVGPPVTVNIYQGCSPAIHNGNLQATDAATVLPVLQEILNH